MSNRGGKDMAVRFLGGNTGAEGSPRLYEDGDDYLWQGYIVDDPEILAELNIPAGETVVRIPKSLTKYLPKDTSGADIA
jgi:hypothetical protein